jgi:calcineurin-like phosphoesterase family protein
MHFDHFDHASSDMHLSHDNIWRPSYADRPVTSTAEHDAFIVDRWNSTVRPNDVVLVLGDVAMGKIADSLPLVGTLHGVKHLIYGNHDRMFGATGAKLDRWMTAYGEHFASIQSFATATVAGVDVDLCHFPYYGDSRLDDRYADQRPVDRGRPLLHGHTHSRDFMHDGNMIHVGVDSAVANYAPIPYDTIVAAIRS